MVICEYVTEKMTEIMNAHTPCTHAHTHAHKLEFVCVRAELFVHGAEKYFLVDGETSRNRFFSELDDDDILDIIIS